MKKEKPESPARTIDRSMTVPVVCSSSDSYKFVCMLVNSFRSILTKLAAENMVFQQAASKVGRGCLLPDGKKKKEVAAALFGVKATPTKNYELRSRFFSLWDEAREASRQKGIELPELGSWVYDATKPKLDAALEIDLFKRMLSEFPQRFENFGLCNLQCPSRTGYCDIVVEGEDIFILFDVDRERNPIKLVAVGMWEMRDKIIYKDLNTGHKSLLRKFADGRMQWSNPRLRLTNSGKLLLDISYKTKPWERNKDSVKGRKFEVTLKPSEIEVGGKDDMRRKVPISLEGHVLEDGKKPTDSGRFEWKGIRCVSEVGYLHQFERERIRRKEQEFSAKSNRDAKGLRRVSEKNQRMEERRHRFCRDACHVWAKEVVEQACRFGCEEVVIRARKGQRTLLHGYNWPWDMLAKSIIYHAGQRGLDASESELVADEAEVASSIVG